MGKKERKGLWNPSLLLSERGWAEAARKRWTDSWAIDNHVSKSSISGQREKSLTTHAICQRETLFPSVGFYKGSINHYGIDTTRLGLLLSFLWLFDSLTPTPSLPKKVLAAMGRGVQGRTRAAFPGPEARSSRTDWGRFEKRKLNLFRRFTKCHHTSHHVPILKFSKWESSALSHHNHV